MSSGTNQERIEQNNLKLTQLKTKADNLPDYQDIEPIYGVSDYKILSSNINLYNRDVLIFSFDNYMSFQDYQSSNIFKILKINDDNTVEQVISTTEFGTNNYKVYYIGKSSENKYYFARMNKFGSNTNVNIPCYVFDAVANSFTQSTFTFRTPNWNYTDIITVRPGIVGFSSKYLYKFDFDNLTYTSETFDNTSFSANNSIPLNSTYLMYGSSSVKYLRNINAGVEKIMPNAGKIISLITVDNSKIIYNKNLYYLNADGTIGNLITENIINTEIQFTWLSGDYYLGQNGLYKFDNASNALIKLFDLEVFSMYETLGNSNVVKVNGKYCTISCIPNTEVVICIKYDGVMYKAIENIPIVTTDKIVDNYQAYGADGSILLGTMPNNGALNYTPSTSQQTIPAGYTSGGTVAAVSMTEQEIEQAETLAETILS